MTKFAATFDALTNALKREFLAAPLVHATKWQSTKAPQPMVEVFNRSFTLDLFGTEDLDVFREAIKPNLPWADRHFEEERVSGEPINPGETWKIWPYARSAAAHLREGENVSQYDHSYAERYWPSLAGKSPDGHLASIPSDGSHFAEVLKRTHHGIRFEYGDLNDLISVLADDPLTRQAYLPIFFPEDTMAAKLGKRVPCTLGYHFICRNNQLHLVYPMRSCDFVRHFRDDVYLTIRLLLWVLENLRNEDDFWKNITPGTFRMHITSLHMFRQDRDNLVISMNGQAQ